MDRQSLAISILEEARDILSRRLIERVIDSREEILDDARGESYLGEIESLHEQIGARLAHVTQILTNLPPYSYDVAAPIYADDDWAPASPAQVDMAFAASSPAASEFVAAHWSPPSTSSPSASASSSSASRGGDAAARALAASSTPSGSTTAASIALMTVSARVQTGEMEAAGRLLATLFDLTPERSQRCAEHFAFGAAVNADFLAQVASLRQLLEAGQWNDVAKVLKTCFGLSHHESQRAVELLSGR